MWSGEAVSFHSGLIAFQTVWEKIEGIALADFEQEESSAAFFTIFVSALVHAYKFLGNLENT